MELTLLITAILCMATLYSMVGHGGGSGYLAVLAIASLAPNEMRTTALLLNVFVATIATWKFYDAGSFRKNLFVPIICASVPASFIGGNIDLPAAWYQPIVAAILLIAAARLFMPIKETKNSQLPKIVLLVLVAASIGLLSGVIGIGGGIFLSPFILLMGFANAKQTAAISAPFILCNSIAALGGIAYEHHTIPVEFSFMAPLVIAAILGGYVGASFGSKRLGHKGLCMTLGVVLIIASVKMIASSIGSPLVL